PPSCARPCPAPRHRRSRARALHAPPPRPARSRSTHRPCRRPRRRHARARTLLSLAVTTVTPRECSLFGEPAAFEGGLHEVAPQTFAWLQPNGDLGESNAGLVVAEGESALIDTLWDVRLTRRMLDA